MDDEKKQDLEARLLASSGQYHRRRRSEIQVEARQAKPGIHGQGLGDAGGVT